MDIYFKYIGDYYCLQGFQCDNDYVSDIIRLWFYKLVEIKLKEKSYDIETEIYVTLIGIYEPNCHSVKRHIKFKINFHK